MKPNLDEIKKQMYAEWEVKLAKEHEEFLESKEGALRKHQESCSECLWRLRDADRYFNCPESQIIMISMAKELHTVDCQCETCFLIKEYGAGDVMTYAEAESLHKNYAQTAESQFKEPIREDVEYPDGKYLAEVNINRACECEKCVKDLAYYEKLGVRNISEEEQKKTPSAWCSCKECRITFYVNKGEVANREEGVVLYEQLRRERKEQEAKRRAEVMLETGLSEQEVAKLLLHDVDLLLQ